MPFEDTQQPPSKGTKEPPRVFVVEDDEDVRASIAESLEQVGFEVRGVANGLDAILDLQSTKGLPRVIVLDLRLPVMDGWRLRNELLRDPRLASIPVVIISAQRELHEVPADAFLRKPIEFDDLVETVKRLSA